MSVFCFLSCQNSDTGSMIDDYTRQGQYYVSRNRLDSAVLCNLKIVDLVDTADMRYDSVLARTYNELGDIFYNVAVFDKSVEMYRKALSYSMPLSDKTQESHARRGIWRCCAAEGNSSGDTVIERTLDLVDHISSRNEIASLYNNLTGYYQYNGDYVSAFECNTRAISMCQDSVNQYRNFGIRSGLFLAAGRYDSAWHYAMRASGSPNIYTKASALMRLSKVAEALKKDSATYYLKYYCTVMDSIQNIRQADSIRVALNRKQLLSLQEENEKQGYMMSGVLVISLIFVLFVIVLFLRRLRRESIRYAEVQREARNQAENLKRLNDELCLNKEQLENYHLQYSDKYRELLERERSMEQTFIQQLVSARKRCISTFKKRTIYRKIPGFISEGNGVLKIADRERLHDAVEQDFALLFHPLSSFLKMSSDDFFLYCLTISGLSTRECAACRGLTDSAIRMQRKRLNDKIRSFFMDQSLIDDILL